MARHETSGNSGRWFEFFAHLVAASTNAIPRVGKFIDTVGSLAGFRFWARQNGCNRHYRSRELLWKGEVVRDISPMDQGTLIEFGVAFGEGTRWWISQISSPNFNFFGFDRFTGLPRPWRDMPAGAFDVGGRPPSIADSRVKWIVGDLEETVHGFDWASLPGKKVLLFDLDLFGVSRICLEALWPFLNAGDLIFFDEAFDADERTLINEYIFPTGAFEFRAISPLGALFERN